MTTFERTSPAAALCAVVMDDDVRGICAICLQNLEPEKPKKPEKPEKPEKAEKLKDSEDAEDDPEDDPEDPEDDPEDLQNVENSRRRGGGACPLHASQFHAECIARWSGACPICRYQESNASPPTPLRHVERAAPPRVTRRAGSTAFLCVGHTLCVAFVMLGAPVTMLDVADRGAGRCDDLVGVAIAALALQLLGYMALVAHFLDSDLCRTRAAHECTPSCMLSVYKALAGIGLLLDAIAQVVISGPCDGPSSGLAVLVCMAVALQLTFVLAAGDRREGTSLL